MSVNLKKLWLMTCIFSASIFFVSLANCQEPQGNSSVQEAVPTQEATPALETTPIQETAPSEEAQTEQATEWIWGEVVSVDVADNQVKLKYTNEDSLEEKEFTVGVDSDTAFEGVQSLLDIKPGDNISVDYTVSEAGVNLAKKIAIERAEDTGLSLPEAEMNSSKYISPY
ncbi:MAG: hypothetical protein PHU91_06395 [Candidatus Omnitrophica bacterium]|nr:hypothetical protein [Candidatus Omnitrophota bacterium]MDD5237269.1 hypothetical protein [Candidatus Omnitrophota bacterium]MDD5611385.1 hypothetical protein [Candidatus Omnitrophota bacterium]